MMENGKPNRVLIAMDGSANAEYAFKWYVENYHRKGDRVIIVHCVEYRELLHTPVLGADPSMIKKIISEEENKVKLLKAKLNEQIKRSEVDGKIIATAGDPGHVIVKTAKEQEVDLIVTGSRGLGTIRRTFMGSVSDYVVHHSDVPVLVVHFPKQNT